MGSESFVILHKGTKLGTRRETFALRPAAQCGRIRYDERISLIRKPDAIVTQKPTEGGLITTSPLLRAGLTGFYETIIQRRNYDEPTWRRTRAAAAAGFTMLRSRAKLRTFLQENSTPA